MKSILLSKQPEIVVNVLNGLSTILVCKKFPKDYVGWVYIYCTKGNGKNNICFVDYGEDNKGYINAEYLDCEDVLLNGKVVARFWCDKVEEIIRIYPNNRQSFYSINHYHDECWLCKCCLTYNDLVNYLGDKKGCAVHISKLEIFDRPKELSELKPIKWNKCGKKDEIGLYQCNKCPYNCDYKYLTKAPQNYCYIEGEE